jgi:hypothetical protein
VLHWIPTRTATVMTLFALCALAAYARSLRLGAKRVRSEITPLDVPATRSSTAVVAGGASSSVWLAVSFFCVLLALGSYEQAVMLPAILVGIGFVFQSKGYVVNWPLQLFFWLELFVYLAVRREVLPLPISVYVDQQLRSGTTAYLSALNYLLPCIGYAPSWISSLSVGGAVLMVGHFYSFPYQVVSNFTAYIASFKQSNVIMLAWACSVVAFLPMAFLKPFSHYHYWAMSLRSIFVILLAGAVAKMIVTAVSPRIVQAPQRPSPAPGSLLHP